ncbi:MAG: hypothetical protein Kow00107_08180 [Planctomycetota bacterium]
MASRKTWRLRIFWLFLLLLVILPTSIVAYVAFFTGSGGLARRVASEISRAANIHVTLQEIQLDDIALSKATLVGLAIHNPILRDYPFLDAGKVRAEGISRSSGAVSVEKVFVENYSIAVPVGGGGSMGSGEAIRKFASSALKIFGENGAVRKLSLGIGRLIVVGKSDEWTLTIASGELGISSTGEIVGKIVLDGLDDLDISARLDISVAGTEGNPNLSVRFSSGEVVLAELPESLYAGLGLKPYGTAEMKLAYRAGFPGKDTVELSASVKAFRIEAPQFSLSASTGDVTMRFTSESATFPDLERITTDPFDPDEPTYAKLTAREVIGTWEGYSAKVSSLETAAEDGRISAALANTVLKAGASSLSVESLRSRISRTEDGYKLICSDPVQGLAVVLPQGTWFFSSCNGDIFLPFRGGLTCDLSLASQSGGDLDLYGNLSTVLPEPLGELRLRLDRIESAQFAPLLMEIFEGTKVDFASVSGSAELSIKGLKSGNGTLNLKVIDLAVVRGETSLAESEALISSDFRYDSGKLTDLRKIQLDVGKLLSFRGSVAFDAGNLSNIVIESTRVSSRQLASLIKRNIKTLGSWDLEGDLLVEGELRDFSEDGLPKRGNLTLSVLDEFSYTLSGVTMPVQVRGMTGRVSVITSLKDGVFLARVDGKLLPQTVMLADKRLFLSSQYVMLGGSLSYERSASILKLERLRFESETGLNEEVTGFVRFGPSAYVDLKFRDWGLTLEQVMSVVEVPETLRLSGGVFILERKITGEPANLQSTYKLTVNGISLDTRSVKIKGAGLLIEFP